MININSTELDYLVSDFLTLYIVYPYDDPTDQKIVEYYIIDSLSYNNPNLSLLSAYYLLQKFFRSYSLSNPPVNGSWHKFFYERVDMDMDELYAYEWVCEIAKIYARKLRERGLITVEEESNLFSGPVIQLKEGDKWALKGYDIEP